MCEFVSWVEKGVKVYFLTGKQVFGTKKGEKLREWSGSADDYIGHGAIRYYYGLEQDEGVNRECVNFTKPSNFPDVIARAIKSGDMSGLAIAPMLLSKPAWAEYYKIRQTALAEYYKIRQTARAEYDKIEQTAFWSLFGVEKYRLLAWQQKISNDTGGA